MTLSLQEISDRLEIQELFTRYCYALDDRDWDAFRNSVVHIERTPGSSRTACSTVEGNLQENRAS